MFEDSGMNWNDFKAVWEISFQCWGLNPYGDYESWERWAVAKQKLIEDVETVDRIIEFYGWDEEWKMLQKHRLTRIFSAIHNLYHWAELPIRLQLDSLVWKIEKRRRRNEFKQKYAHTP